MKKLVIILCLFICALTITSFLMTQKKSQKASKIVSLLEIHSTLYGNKEAEIEVPYYLDSRVHSFQNEKQINNVILFDNQNFMISLELESIEYLGKQSLQKSTYFGYILRAKVPKIEIHLDKAFIRLENEKEKIEFQIGSFDSKEEGRKDTALTVDTLYGINQDNVFSVGGIVIDFYNKGNQKLIIDSIYISNHSILNIEAMKELDLNQTFSTFESIDSILGVQYDYYRTTNAKLEIEVAPYETRRFFFPLIYLQKGFIDSFPLEITYKTSSEEATYSISPFPFYENEFRLSDYERSVCTND